MPSTAISAQGSTVSIGTTTGSAINITAVALTNPCRITLPAVTGLAKGDVITVAGVIGTTQLNGNSDAGQLALMTALVTGVAKSFKLLLPNGNTPTFTAYVKKFNSQGAVDQAIRRSAELRISGSITWA